MNSVINLGVPHLGEQIFDYIDTPTLIQFRFVSHTWKIIAENVLVNRWKDKDVLMSEEFDDDVDLQTQTIVVKLLLEHPKGNSINWNAINTEGWTPFMMACANGNSKVVQLFIRGGTGLSPTRARARPRRFFVVFRVPEPEVFETGQARLGPSPRVKPAGTRGYPKVMFYKTLYVTKCFMRKKIREI